MLAYPDFSKDFTLETDASKLRLGAILSQHQEDQKLHPVAYASRSISNAEANYAIIDLETLAVVWAVTHFRYYLYGRKKNPHTDCLSRQPVMPAPPDEDANTDVQIAQISCTTPSTVDGMLQEEPRVNTSSDGDISEEQLKDPELKPIIFYLRNGTLPEDTKLAKKVEMNLVCMQLLMIYFIL